MNAEGEEGGKRNAEEGRFTAKGAKGSEGRRKKGKRGLDWKKSGGVRLGRRFDFCTAERNGERGGNGESSGTRRKAGEKVGSVTGDACLN